MIAGTLFESTKLALTVWFPAIYLDSQAKTGLSALVHLRANTDNINPILPLGIILPQMNAGSE